jgi:type VI secretion system secreted protein Hcp
MAVDMFLKIDGIDGESRDHKHKGEIELLSFSWGLANSSTTTGGGGGAGKTVVQDFSIIKQISASSPQLMEKCCTGEHIKDVTITLVNKETKEEYLKIKLQDCLISSYQTGGAGNGGAVPMDQVSFNFSSVDVQASDKRGGYSQVQCNFQKGGGGIIGHNH